MPASKPFTVCNECGSWVYNWRLDKQGGRCKCGVWLELFQKNDRPPWHKHKGGEQRAGSPAPKKTEWGPKPGEPDSKVAALEYLAGGNSKLAKEIEELQKKHAAATPAAQPRQPDAWQALTRAKGWHQKAKKKLEESEDELQRLDEMQSKARHRRDLALEEAFDADQERTKASERYYQQVAKGDQKAEEVPTIFDFSLDHQLEDTNLDDYEDGAEKDAVLAFRTKVEELQQAGQKQLEKIQEAEGELSRQQAAHVEEAKTYRVQAEEYQKTLLLQVGQLPNLRNQLKKKRKKADGGAAAPAQQEAKEEEQPEAEEVAKEEVPENNEEEMRKRKEALLAYQEKCRTERRPAASAKGQGKKGKKAHAAEAVLPADDDAPEAGAGKEGEDRL